MTDEVRVTSATGGQKGSKPAQLAWADPRSLLALGEVYGYGGEKYSPTNYRQGYAWSLSFNALMRHLLAFWSGEDSDPESGLPHVAHAAWHCLALHSFALDHPQFDDRVKSATDASLPADVAEEVMKKVEANRIAWQDSSVQQGYVVHNYPPGTQITNTREDLPA